jgi:hypothetical protein
MGLEEVGEVMKTVNKRVEGTPVPRAEKKKVTEVYDLVRHKPTKDYQEVYEKVKREYAELGLVFE